MLLSLQVKIWFRPTPSLLHRCMLDSFCVPPGQAQSTRSYRCRVLAMTAATWLRILWLCGDQFLRVFLGGLQGDCEILSYFSMRFSSTSKFHSVAADLGGGSQEADGVMGGAGARRCCSGCLIRQDAMTAADQGILGLADTRGCLLQGRQGCHSRCTACRARAHSQRILCIAMAMASCRKPVL